MLERLHNFIGSTVLALALVYGLAYLALGNWTMADVSPQTASNIEQTAPAPR